MIETFDRVQVQLPAGARVGDLRGLTATGAAVVVLGSGFLGALIDAATGSGLRSAFAILFTLGCAVAAYKVHREDLAAAAVIPPLAFVALAFVAGLGSDGVGASGLVGNVLDLFSTLVLGAPALLLASASAGVVAGLRWLALRTAALDAAAQRTPAQG